MKCVLLGATRGCGLETLLNLTAAGHECYTLCRSPAQFETTLAERNVDPNAATDKKKLINLVKGDAFNADDVRKIFEVAGEGVEFVLFSLGGRPTFKNPLSPKLMPPAICSRTINVFLPIFVERFPDPTTQPRLVVISSNGLGHQGHSDLPWLLKPLYGWLLKEPHADKEEMERLVNIGAGIKHVDFNPLGVQDTKLQLGNVVIVRPALLTEGIEKGTANIREGERLSGAWTVSRKDVGAFIAKECALPDSQWRNKGVTIAY
ncbi:hypothetical protein BDZ91DRAFT_551310 [Kalaharituber pfeilii]|nr:hypothetical protein BDZ91DRAFT_551310 [Kalaharituber pfeilii]